MANFRNSLAYTLADSYTALPLQLVATMIISRILTPAETGIFAVAAVFASLASTFRDFGVAEYLIQERELAEDQLRASLTVNIVISWLMGLLLFSGAAYVADFYREPGVAEVMRVQAINFLLIPFGAVTVAWFRRQMDFRPVFLCNFSGNITGFVVSVACAMQGFGYMSLAWASLCSTVVVVGLSLWLRPADFPRWPGLRGIGAVLRFGRSASGIYILGRLGQGAPEIIIGRALDTASVAYFNRGGGIVELFNQVVIRAVSPLCLPYLSQENRELGSIVNGYLTALRYLTGIGWPILAFGACMAFPAVRLIYGVQWLESVPLTQVLCVVAMVSLIHIYAKEALVSVQQVVLGGRLQFFVQGARICGIAAVVPFGLLGACYGLLVAAIFSFAVSQHYLARTTGLRYAQVLRACLPSLRMTLIAVGPVALWNLFDPPSEANFLVALLGRGTLFVLLWLFSLRLTGRPLWSELNSLLDQGQHYARRIIGK